MIKYSREQLNNSKEKHFIPLSQRASGVDHPDYAAPPETPPEPYERGADTKKQPQPVENVRPKRKAVKEIKKPVKKSLPLSMRFGNLDNPDTTPVIEPTPYVRGQDDREPDWKKSVDHSQPTPRPQRKSQPTTPSLIKRDAVSHDYPVVEPVPEVIIPYVRGYNEKPKPPPQPEHPLTFAEFIEQAAPALAVLRDIEAHLRNVRGFRPVHTTWIWLLTPDALCGTILRYDNQQYSLPPDLVARIQALPKGEYLCSEPWGELKNYHAWLRNERDVLYPEYRAQFALEQS